MTPPAKGRASSPPATGRGKSASTLDDSVRVVILRGAELFDRTTYLQELRANVIERRGDADVVYFDGQSDALADVLDECRSMNLMGAYKIVVLDQADEMLKKEGMRPILERYVQSPVESATLVLRAATWRPGKIDKMVEKVGRVIKCDARSPSQAVTFSVSRAKEVHGSSIERRAAELLVDRLGTDLGRLDRELERLSLMAEAQGTKIDVDLVASQIGLSHEEKAWVIQDAILQGDPSVGMNKILDLLKVTQSAPEPIFYSLTDLARKLYAASVMLGQRHHPREIASRLRLHSAAQQAIFDAARRLSPAILAKLVDASIEAAVRPRQGVGDSKRSVEMLTARFITTLHGDGR